MKTIILAAILCVFVLVTSAQNEIYLIGSNKPIKVSRFKIRSWVLQYYPEGKKDSIKYFYPDTVDFFIRNGSYYTYSLKEKIERVHARFLTNEISRRGALDACKNYTKYGGATAATGFSTFFVTIAGLGVAIGTSSTPPREKNLDIPSGQFMNDSVYIGAYKGQAKKIKTGKVWNAFGSGVLYSVLFGIIFGSLTIILK